MKLIANLTLYKPVEKAGQVIGQVGIQELIAEDVASIEFDENNLHIHFNNSPDQVIPLRDNDSEGQGDWRAANLQLTKKFLEIDVTK